MIKKLKEKINNNEIIQLFLRLWANKRYRSILSLCLYFVFFFIIIFTLRTNYNNQQLLPPDNDISMIQAIIQETNSWYNKNYSYQILVNEQEIIKGSIQEGINSFLYNDKTYTVINSILYEQNSDSFNKVTDEVIGLKIPLNTIDLSKLFELFKSLDAVIEDEVQGKQLIVYQIPIYKFIESSSNISVQTKVIATNNILESLELDFSEYLDMQYQIIIEYTNN